MSKRTLVSCGDPSFGDNVELRIIDPVTSTSLGAGMVGEVWITSPSKACGYWGHPEVTLNDFHSLIADGASEVEGAQIKNGDGGGNTMDSSCDSTCRDVSSALNVAERGEGYLRTGLFLG